ncbi:hypothetical protein [Niveispirillum sp. KHB5.9]|uniref:hypothetical protein n=1 Tax=Niveispirillum sp. KHB5.9 TaxID=3400269 RepID=UPI003A89A333
MDFGSICCQHCFHGLLADALKIGCSGIYWHSSFVLVRRILRLAFLAPDITEAILRGGQPRELTLTVLTSTDLPDDWQAQRHVLGFPEPV